MKRILIKDLQLALDQAQKDLSTAIAFLIERAKMGDGSATMVLGQLGYTPFRYDADIPEGYIYLSFPQMPPVHFLYTGLRSNP